MPLKKRIARESPLSEITLRKYERPSKLNERELVRKLCLSLGLLQPGDSRDVIVDIVVVLLRARKKKKPLRSEEIETLVISLRKKQKLPLLGIAGSNIRRQLKRLKDILIVEKVRKSYRIVEFSPLEEIFKERIEKFLLQSTLERVKDYMAFVSASPKRK